MDDFHNSIMGLKYLKSLSSCRLHGGRGDLDRVINHYYFHVVSGVGVMG